MFDQKLKEESLVLTAEKRKKSSEKNPDKKEISKQSAQPAFRNWLMPETEQRFLKYKTNDPR